MRINGNTTLSELKHSDELMHYGVKGMKWGVRKSVYKSMTREQRKAQKKKYLSTPEGYLQRRTEIGSYIGGPIGAAIAYKMAKTKLSSVSKQTKDRGKAELKKRKNTKFETDKEKIERLRREGKDDPKAHYYFDQNGALLMVTWDD